MSLIDTENYKLSIYGKSIGGSGVVVAMKNAEFIVMLQI